MVFKQSTGFVTFHDPLRGKMAAGEIFLKFLTLKDEFLHHLRGFLTSLQGFS